MTLLEQIKQRVQQLPPEKQSEVLDFATFLQQQLTKEQSVHRSALQQHPAFGSWRGRNIDALQYQQDLRAEWNARP